MRTFTNRVVGLVLALAMIAAFVLVPMPTDIKANAATVTSTNLVSNIQDGVTLQCWNWSIANIKANLGLIANSGYSAIQVSPMQEMKEGTVNKPVNNWWAVYQPISFNINKSQSHCVGTKEELIDLCNEAHKYGIKVIMDVVFNHTANNGANQLCPMVDPDFLNDPACWHDYSQNSSSYNDRYDVTQRCMAGLPDLNTGNQKVQDKALALMKEYVDCGVDGFRFDAAKQIETPDDHSSYASDFWPTVVNGTTSYAQSTRGITPYYYGELLQDTDNYGSLPISAYTKYMSATESVWSNDIRYKMEEHNASALRMSYFKDAPADKLVLWAESHDTIGDLSSLYSSDYVRNKAWALAASRAYTMALYFPRSNYMTNIDPNAKDRIYQEMGELAKLGWSSEFTKQVNYFHNHFAGQSERLTQDTGANLYYNERGNSGVIITNFNDGGRDINLPVYAMASGTYYDQLTGNKFTVSGGRITGKMGDTGVAVVYNPSSKSCSHSSHGADGYCYSCFAYVGHKSGSTCSTCGTASTRTIYFMNNESWSTPYIYGWHDSAGEATSSWPGTKMTKVEGSIWSATIPTTATNIIFNDGNGKQTPNLVPSASDDTYDNEFGTWSTRGEVVVADNYYLFYTTNSGAYNSYDYRFVDGKLTMSFEETSYVWLIDSNGVQYMCDGWPGEVTSAKLKTLDAMSGTPDKMPVPHSKTLTFTMTHNTDGSITLSYVVGGSSSGGSTGGNTGGNEGGTTTTNTIYFDASSKGWSNVNVYTWDDSQKTYTGEWPGSAMTKVSGSIYSYKVPTGAKYIIFNNGTSQTSDLTIPTDGKNQYNGSSWSVYGSSSGNEGGSTGGGDVTGGNAPDNTYYLFWGNSTGSLNHNDWDTCFMDGKVTVTFAETMYVWVITNVDGTQYMTEGWAGNVNSVKLYRQPLLSNPNKLMIPAGTHTLTLSQNSDGSLTLAYGAGNTGNEGGSTGGNTGGNEGGTTTSTNYYLVGWINGADYGCEGDYENMGIYKFVDGKLTTKFTEDSYIFVKTEGNGKWLMANAYCQDTACTFVDGGTEKMFVPGGVDLTFTLTENADGSVTISYVQAGSGDVGGGDDTEGKYVQVTDLNEILSGGEFIIAVKNGTTYRALSQSISGMTIAATNVTVNGNVASGAPVFTVKPASGGVIFNVNGTDVSFGGSPAVLVVAKGTTGFTVTAQAISSYGILYNIPNDQFMITTVSNAGSKNYISEALFFKYTEGGATEECTHSYTSSVTTAATCDRSGVKSFTCSKCGDRYTEVIPALGHNYVNGSCTNCGGSDGSVTPTVTYYLVGWINDADYGCESDHENNGIYKFVNGQLSAKFDSDSYIFVKTENNGKWLLADSYCTETTCTFKEGGSEKMFVPGGVDLIFNIIENADGSVTVSYTKGGATACTHSYTSEVTTEATCTTAGVRTHTCTKCGHSYTQPIAANGHNFFGGSCSVCGIADPSGTPSTGTTYYLVGYINGADHGCEADWQNLGNYKFVNGRLTAKFTQDSYVFVKTGDNQDFLLAPSYCEASTCSFAVGNTEKMFVPAGIEFTFVLTENTDGSVSVTYTSGNTPASVIPTLTLKSPTLEFKDMITINAFYTAENTQDVVEMGMITYTSKVDRWSVRTAEHVVPGASYIESSGRYYSASQGIHAKYLADTFYLATYAKLADGSYVYSKLAPYSPMTYANSQLKNSTDMKLKQLAVAMLNYGAEAQLYFGHNTGNLANAALNAEHLALPEAYRADMVSSVPAASATKQGSFANNSGFSSRYPAISFEGAFCINYFFTPKYAPANGITLYYWNAADYNAASVLTTANASGSIKLEGSGTGEYRGDITGISAKALSEAVYVAAVYKNGSTTWTSGVLGYSIGSYCSSQASKGGDIADLAMATAVYGYHAKAYFG